MELLLEKNRVIMWSIMVALVSLAISYAVHVEYFKAFAVVFGLGGATSALFGSSLPTQKVKNATVLVILGSVIYVIAWALWK